MRASDFDDRRDDRKPDRDPHRARRHHALVVDGSGSSDQSSSEVSMDVNMVSEDESAATNSELEEIYAVQRQAKKDFKRSFKTYKESRPLLHSRTNMMVSQTVDKPLRRSSRPSSTIGSTASLLGTSLVTEIRNLHAAVRMLTLHKQQCCQSFLIWWRARPRPSLCL